MGVYLKEQKIACFTIPKCASSTLKHFFFELECGHPYEEATEEEKEAGNVHKRYPTRRFKKFKRPIEADAWKFAVLRDPIGRVLSCYSNRVIHGECLKSEAFAKSNADGKLSVEPTLEQFINRFRLFRQRSLVVRYHCRPLRHLLGQDPTYFDALYDITQMDELHRELDKRIEGPIPAFARHQTGGPKIPRSELTERMTKKLHDLFAEDFDLYGKYFKVPTPA